MDSYSILEHQTKVNTIQKDWVEKKHEAKDATKRYSNTMRKKEYSAKAFSSLRLQSLNQLLAIDAKRKVAWVEPGMTMESLVDACLPHGFIPSVVPEFKGISVGGAINGAALESTSHKYGQFNDTCLSYEILLGDGKIIKATPNEFSDIFYAISSAYGTLGFLLSTEIQLIPTTGWLSLHYVLCNSYEEALSFMQKLHRGKNPPHMMEAIVYNAQKSVVIYGGEITREEAKTFPLCRINGYADEWFYSHVDQITSIHDTYQEAVSIRDYLFRHDRGAFWMAGFALHPRLLSHYWLHKLRLEQKNKGIPHCIPKNPSRFFRYLFGWFLSSQVLYGSLHNGSEDWFEKHFVIQDFYLPEANAAAFVEHVLKQYRISPLWICPILATTKPQFFSPHHQMGQNLLFNVGVYGIPFGSDGPNTVKDLEKRMTLLQGKKMFYCHTYFSKEKFWEIYPYSSYKDLRKKYGFEGMIPQITDKVLKT